jgi:hypothetical protein
VGIRAPFAFLLSFFLPCLAGSPCSLAAKEPTVLAVAVISTRVWQDPLTPSLALPISSRALSPAPGHRQQVTRPVLSLYPMSCAPGRDVAMFVMLSRGPETGSFPSWTTGRWWVGLQAWEKDPEGPHLRAPAQKSVCFALLRLSCH